METDNYPKNKEIQMQRIAVSELKATNDWKAVKMATDDLISMEQEKSTWLDNRC